MMSASLVWSLTGLALLDSINVSTIWVVVIILLAAKRPASTGWAYALGAFASFFAITLLLYFGATFAESMLADLTLWLRRILFTALAIFLLAIGIRKLKARPRKAFGLPSWVNAWTALPLGLLATLGDIPNAFPLFLAVERIIDAGIQPPIAVPLLAAYTAVYAFPTLVILILGLVLKDRVRGLLQRAYDRYATGETKPSWKLASLCFLGSAASVTTLIFIIG
ncbi:GAP family protein [Pseudoclavibacter sp. RFBA6]|uniref:GAP family protein n=1 Tax=Pseudoclavibacter sp. RFBA6 TaxID=2080573 RepID=UPI000CE7BC4E|nr:GAP family protein [Pseudoclavibacter sp. RFBA6]PPG37455.1 hypothetical protein C5C17_17790 [Pseudoclavibacter sp. RFBA6]